MQKTIKYILLILTIIIILIFSVKVKKLDKYKAENIVEEFNANDFALNIWDNELPTLAENAPDFPGLLNTLQSNPEQSFKKYGKKLGISATYYFLTKGKGTVVAIEDEWILLQINDNIKIKVATSYIFGNAVRDGSGKVNINEFIEIQDFNNVSLALNKLVKEKTIPILKNNATVGTELEFAGAFELNEKTPDFDNIRLIPIFIKITNG